MAQSYWSFETKFYFQILSKTDGWNLSHKLENRNFQSQTQWILYCSTWRKAKVLNLNKIHDFLCFKFQLQLYFTRINSLFQLYDKVSVVKLPLSCILCNFANFFITKIEYFMSFLENCYYFPGNNLESGHIKSFRQNTKPFSR